MALAQRQIRVSRADIPMNRQRRKHIPSIIATLGDYMQAKRYEKGLHRYQVADKMGIAASLVSVWESGNSTPDKTDSSSSQKLAEISWMRGSFYFLPLAGAPFHTVLPR